MAGCEPVNVWPGAGGAAVALAEKPAILAIANHPEFSGDSDMHWKYYVFNSCSRSSHKGYSQIHPFFRPHLPPKSPPTHPVPAGAYGVNGLFFDRIGLQGLWNVREQLSKLELSGLP